MAFHEEEPDFTHLTNSLQSLRESLLERGFGEKEAFQLVKLYFGLTLEAHLSSPAFMEELEKESFNGDNDEDDDSELFGRFMEGDDEDEEN